MRRAAAPTGRRRCQSVSDCSGSVRLHAFTFASNHFHLLVWARGASLSSVIPRRHDVGRRGITINNGAARD
ncbi:hypothetical protein DAT35_15545 [Vitiosangium sp. GDMCC 1.1324]|nr:hypothetical protein DAT35_15545 [Vitiosangium sp. GDMCC 1.1324]